MNTFHEIKNVIMEILDVEEDQILPETYLIRELDAESIDLLELAVSLNTVFKKEIIDDDIFLRKLSPELCMSIPKETTLLEKYRQIPVYTT